MCLFLGVFLFCEAVRSCCFYLVDNGKGSLHLCWSRVVVLFCFLMIKVSQISDLESIKDLKATWCIVSQVSLTTKLKCSQ